MQIVQLLSPSRRWKGDKSTPINNLQQQQYHANLVFKRPFGRSALDFAFEVNAPYI